MRTLLLLILTALGCSISAQSLDSLGKNDDPVLSHYESEYLNKELKGQRKSFDFTDRKMIFITGSSATNFLTKSDYFKEVKKKNKTKAGIHQTLVIFDIDEIKDTGYDGMIMVEVKLLTDKRKKEIVKLLKRANESAG